MNKDEVLNLDNQLCFAFYTCSRKIINLYKPYLDKLGLTYTQYITMLVLWESPSITFKDLGNRLFLDSGTLTPLLKKLEKTELLERKRSISDERNVIISLTSKGEELKIAAQEIPDKMFCATGISIKEAIELREQIKKLINQIDS